MIVLEKTVVEESVKPVSTFQVYLQLALNLLGLMLANQITIDMWRALTGH